MQDVARQGRSYIVGVYNSEVHMLRRADVLYMSPPHNGPYNWVKRNIYSIQYTKNRFAYNTGTIINIVSGIHATSTTSHWKPV